MAMQYSDHRIPDTTVRMRMDKLWDRTKATTIPPLQDLYGKETIDSDISRTLVDKVYFSEYPDTSKAGSSALCAFILNSSNVDDIRKSGGNGAIIEMFTRINIKKEARSVHVENLVHSMHALCVHDTGTQHRTLCNPGAIKVVLALCRHTIGTVQELCFEILEVLSKLDSGMSTLVDNGLINTLMTPQILLNKKTSLHVKHNATNYVHRASLHFPKEVGYMVEPFEKMALKKYNKLESNFDHYMEIQLLHALHHHIMWLDAQGLFLPNVFTLFKFLLSEILNEECENLDHMHLILKLVVICLKDKKQMEFMLDNDLLMILQYLVRTDFELFSKKVSITNSRVAVSQQSMTPLGQTSASLSAESSPKRNIHRPPRTLMALEMIKSPKKLSSGSRNEDINLSTSRMVLNVYEGLMCCKDVIIGEVVGSGLIPSLLFRVGKGVAIDKHFNKLLTGFILFVLKKITASGPIICSDNALGEAPVVDIYSITNTIHAQGVTDMIISSLIRSEDNEVIGEAYQVLKYMSFEVIQHLLFSNDVLIGRICLLCHNRLECFAPGLEVICQLMLLNPELDPHLRHLFVNELKMVPLLVRALRPASMLIMMKDAIYTSMTRLCEHPDFYEHLKKALGIEVLVYEMDHRKKFIQSHRRDRAEMEDDGTMRLLKVLRHDWAAMKLQSMYRIFLRRVHKSKTTSTEAT